MGMLKATVTDWIDDEAPRLGAALAYYAVFSLAPLLVIIVAVVGFFYRGNSAAEIEQQISAQVGPQAAGLLAQAIDSSNDLGAGIIATVIGVLVLIMGATGVLVELRTAMNKIFDITPHPSSGVMGFLKERATALMMVLVVAFLLLASMMASALLSTIITNFSGVLPGSNYVWPFVDLGVSLAVITVLFALLFRYVPDERLEWKNVWVGAAITAVLFIIGKYLIGLYIAYGAVGSTFGVAGSLMVLLAWIYYSAQILFLGAEFTQVYANQDADRRARNRRPAA